MGQYLEGKMVKYICEGCDFPFDDPRILSNFVSAICSKINMTSLAGPFMGQVDEGGDNDGISVVLLIKESHIASHFWNRHKAVRIVVDSCKDFDVEILERFFIDILKPTKIYIATEIWDKELVVDSK